MAGETVGTGKRTLYFREGGSDRVYEVQIMREGGGYVVTFAYGRRGATLKRGTKTPQAVPRAEAEALLEKLLGEKKAKGYREAAPADPVADAEARDEFLAKVSAARSSTATTVWREVNAEVSRALRDLERRAANCLLAYPAGATDVSLVFDARVDRKQRVKLEWHRVVDPAFGALSTDGDLWWTARRTVISFGDDVSVHVDIPNRLERRRAKERVPPPPQPPTAKQRDAFKKFMSDPERYRRVVEQANWDFYRQNIYEGEDDGYPPDVTGLEEPADVWKLLGRPSITIPLQAGAGWWLEFSWECRWDREHGHKVVLCNGKVSSVGQQG